MLSLPPRPPQTYNYGKESYDKGNAYAQVAISTKVSGAPCRLPFPRRPYLCFPAPKHPLLPGSDFRAWFRTGCPLSWLCSSTCGGKITGPECLPISHTP